MNNHRKLRLGFLGALVLFIGTGILSEYCLKRSTEDSAWVSHTYQVLAELQELSTAQIAFEEAQEDSLSQAQAHVQTQQTGLADAHQQVMAHFRRLRYLTADNPAQQRRLDILQPLLDQTLTPEKQNIRQIRAELEKMMNTEKVLSQRRVIWSHDSSLAAAVLISLGTLLGAVFIAIGSFRVERELRRREDAEAALREAQEVLELRVEERTAELSNTTASLQAQMVERQKAEQELRQSEQRYRLLFEDSPLPMEIFDPETLAYLDVNKATRELYGYTRDEFLNMTLKDIRPAEEVPVLIEFLNAVKDTESYTGTFFTRHKNGKLITIDVKVRTIRFGERKVRLKLITDVTEHKRLETRLQQSQKIEAVGRLAGGIAHDFNNLLTLILGYSDSMLRELDYSSPLRSQVSEILVAGRRAANLTRQLLAFSRKQILKPQVLQLNSVVSDISQMLRRLLGEDIHISLHLDADLGQVQADPTQLEQVLINLAVNARDAMPDGGQLVIESHNVELDARTAALQGVPEGRYVVLEVSDTGCGMDEKTKSRVFEPFFTTKEVGKGTGLGLSMVLGVVQQSGGTVTIYSEPGIGTTFKIYLPRLDNVAPPEPAEETKSKSLHAVKDATILLVEDEPSLRALARNVLRQAGYNVFEAGNGKEALQVVNELPSPPDLLLTDVVMPEMNGLELADRLQRKWPGLAVVYTSGYTDHALLERNVLRQDMPFLQKPYMPDAMLNQVAATLEKNGHLNEPAHELNLEHAALLAIRN